MKEPKIVFYSDERTYSQEKNLARHERLLKELGNGADWIYDRCEEDLSLRSECVCGTVGLRWCFIIKHRATGKEKIVGSSCIERLEQLLSCANAGLVSDLRKALEKLKEELKQKVAAARKLAKDQEIETAYKELLSKHQQLYQLVAALYKHGLPVWAQPRVDLNVYMLVGGPATAHTVLAERRAAYERIPFKPYKSKPAFLKAIKKKIAEYDYALQLL